MLTSTRLTATGLLAGLALSFAVPAMAVTATIFPASEITQAEVEAAQRAWADALLEIGAAGEPDKAKEIAVKRVGELYGYEIGPVLFKPTLTETPQTFRTTEEGAISYFVGQTRTIPRTRASRCRAGRTCRSKMPRSSSPMKRRRPWARSVSPARTAASSRWTRPGDTSVTRRASCRSWCTTRRCPTPLLSEPGPHCLKAG